MLKVDEIKLAIIGLGYVGLPLAAEFGKHRSVVGFDINQQRIAALKAGHDETLEVSDEELALSIHLNYSAEIDDIRACNTYIVTVPTPIDAHKKPDLTPLIKASQTIGKVLKKGDIVIYESTVYPGATEEDCVPILEQVSGLKFNTDFLPAIAPSVSIRGTKNTALPLLRKSRLVPRRKLQSWSTPCIDKSSSRGHTKPAVSKSRKRPRSSRTLSAT